jgi:hypothetical protein
MDNKPLNQTIKITPVQATIKFKPSDKPVAKPQSEEKH